MPKAASDCSKPLLKGRLKVLPVRNDSRPVDSPAGRADATGASRLSLPPMRRILDEARQFFDIVLIDSGPILGSVEASVVAQDVEGVILIVARGQQVPLVKRALAQLRAVDARIAGMVFNRADAKEFSRAGYASSMRTRRGQTASWTNDGSQPRRFRLATDQRRKMYIQLVLGITALWGRWRARLIQSWKRSRRKTLLSGFGRPIADSRR